MNKHFFVSQRTFIPRPDNIFVCVSRNTRLFYKLLNTDKFMEPNIQPGYEAMTIF